MGHQPSHHRGDHANTPSVASGVHPAVADLLDLPDADLVAALPRARVAENLAVFSQLATTAALWVSWRPDDAARRADRRARRRDVGAEALHDACVVTETAAALGLTENAASQRLDAALALLVEQRLPRAAALTAQGRLDWVRLKLLVTKTRDLTGDQAAAVEAKVLLPAVLTLTIGLYERALDRAVLAADPTAADRGRKEAQALRNVAFYRTRNGADGLDGAATLTAQGPAEALTAAWNALDAEARRLRADGDPRTLPQLRHDLLVARCTGTLTSTLTIPDGAPTRTTGNPTRTDAADDAADDAAPLPDDLAAAPPADRAVPSPRTDVPVHLTVTVSLQTLLGLNDHPGDLDGYGPVPAQMVRELATTAIWRCVAVDDTHGTVLGVGTRTYTPGYVPGSRLRQFLTVAAPTCLVPWCTARAERCDLDHRTPYADGGATCCCTVGPLCRRHHRQKSVGDLTLEPSNDPAHPIGTLLLTTRAGQRLVVLPHAPLPPEAYTTHHLATQGAADSPGDATQTCSQADEAPPATVAPPF